MESEQQQQQQQQQHVENNVPVSDNTMNIGDGDAPMTEEELLAALAQQQAIADVPSHKDTEEKEEKEEEKLLPTQTEATESEAAALPVEQQESNVAEEPSKEQEEEMEQVTEIIPAEAGTAPTATIAVQEDELEKEDLKDDKEKDEQEESQRASDVVRSDVISADEVQVKTNEEPPSHVDDKAAAQEQDQEDVQQHPEKHEQHKESEEKKTKKKKKKKKKQKVDETIDRLVYKTGDSKPLTSELTLLFQTASDIPTDEDVAYIKHLDMNMSHNLFVCVAKDRVRLANLRSKERIAFLGSNTISVKFITAKDDTTRLAIVREDGTIIMRRVSVAAAIESSDSSTEGSSDEKKKKKYGITHKKVLDRQMVREDTGDKLQFRTAAWHPTKMVMAVATDLNEIVIIDFEVLKNVKDAFDTRTEGVTVLQPARDGSVVPNVIRFSDNGRYIAAGFSDSTVKIWSGADYRLLTEWTPFENDPDAESIKSIHFTGRGLSPMRIPDHIIVGGRNNTKFMLAKLEWVSENGGSLRGLPVQTVLIEGVDTTARHCAELDETSSFLFVASSVQPTLYSLHIKLDNDSNILFDHVAECSTDAPVLDMCAKSYIHDAEKKDITVGLFYLDHDSSKLMQLRSDQLRPAVEYAKEDVQKQQAEEANEKQQESGKPDEKPSVTTEPAKEEPGEDIKSAAESAGEESEASSTTATTPKRKAKKKKRTTDAENVAPAPTANAVAPKTTAKKAKYTAPVKKRPPQAPVQAKPKDSTVTLATIQSMIDSHFNRLIARLDKEKNERQEKENALAASIMKTVKNDLVVHITKAMRTVVMPNLHDEVRNAVADAMDAAGIQQTDGGDQSSRLQSRAKDEFRKVLASTMVPKFQSTCEKMFSQIVEAFDQTMETHVSQPMETFLHRMNDEVIGALDNHMREVSKISATGTASRGDSKQGFRDVIKQIDRIMDLFKQDRYNEGFIQALEQRDLSLLAWVCKQLNPDALINMDPMPLEQTIVLSLIQQLSWDLNNDADVKLLWLEKLGIVLDPTDRDVAHSAASILESTLDKLTKAQRKFKALKRNADAVKAAACKHIINSQLMEATTY